MADIELVIKISEKTYKAIINDEWIDTEYINNTIVAIKNSTPLPKGHGDLKDMDDIYEALDGWDEDTGWIVDAIDSQTQTIIEADKENKE